jgi:hypothetical protein
MNLRKQDSGNAANPEKRLKIPRFRFLAPALSILRLNPKTELLIGQGF